MLLLNGMSESPNSKSDKFLDDLIHNPLELPDGASFVSVGSKVTIQQMIALSEKHLPALNSQPDFIEKKIKMAINVPFSF